MNQRRLNIWWRLRVGMLLVVIVCALVSGTLLALCVDRWRAPAFGIECQYISTTLNVLQQWRAGQDIMAALCDWQGSLGNASVLSSLAALPWVTLVPGRQSMLWLSTLICASLAVVVLTHLITSERVVSKGFAAALAEVASALMIWTMPLFLGQAVTFNAVAPAVLVAALALRAYCWAWRRDTRWAWGLASLVLLSSWWAKPEWSGVFICLMILMQCVDTWWHSGWRAGVTSLAVFAGIIPWVVFVLYPWRADRGSFVLLGVLFLATGAWLILLERGGRATQRTAVYMLPALAGVSAWLTMGENGRVWLHVVREALHASGASQSVRDMLRSEWYATPLALIIVLGFALIGSVEWWRKWRGFVFLGTTLGLTTFLIPIQPEIQAVLFGCVVACWAGVGVVQALRKWQSSGRGFLTVRARAPLLIGLLLLLVSWQLPRAVADMLVPAYRTTVPIFDRSRAGWEVISRLRAILPNDITCAYTPDTPALSRLTLTAYAELYGWGWDVRPWPQDVTNAPTAWLIILAPDKASAVTRYFPDPRVAEHCANQQAAVESSGRYRMATSASLAHGSFVLLVYQRAPLSPE